MASQIAVYSGSVSITLAALTRPSCRVPTFTAGVLKLGASMMPAELLPIISVAVSINDKNACLGMD